MIFDAVAIVVVLERAGIACAFNGAILGALAYKELNGIAIGIGLECNVVATEAFVYKRGRLVFFSQLFHKVITEFHGTCFGCCSQQSAGKQHGHLKKFAVCSYIAAVELRLLREPVGIVAVLGGRGGRVEGSAVRFLFRYRVAGRGC